MALHILYIYTSLSPPFTVVSIFFSIVPTTGRGFNPPRLLVDHEPAVQPEVEGHIVAFRNPGDVGIQSLWDLEFQVYRSKVVGVLRRLGF